MICISCKRKIEGEGVTIVCSSCRSIDNFRQYIKADPCKSFRQKKGGEKGECEYCFSCAPMKKALQKQMILSPYLGHKVCPHPEENLRRLIYGEFTLEEIMSNYLEYIK